MFAADSGALQVACIASQPSLSNRARLSSYHLIQGNHFAVIDTRSLVRVRLPIEFDQRLWPHLRA